MMDYEVTSFKAKWLPSRDEMRRKVCALEAAIEPYSEQVCTMKHHFAPHLYAREMFMPKGTTLTGAVHKTEHLILIVGDCEVLTDSGVKRFTGHNTFVSKAGAKRAMYAHEDTWVTGFFVTDKTNVRELEDELVEDSDSLQYRKFENLELESCS